MVERSTATIELSPFEDDEGARMLLHYMKREEPYNGNEIDQAYEISNLLGGLPVVSGRRILIVIHNLTLLGYLPRIWLRCSERLRSG